MTQGQFILYEHVTPPPRHRPPLADPAGPGFFFAERTHLPAGTHAFRFQVMLPPEPPLGARLVAAIRRLDGDGRLLTCCNDFPKRSDLGSHATASLPELLKDERRRRLFRQLRNRDWQQIEGCRTCLFDDPQATQAAARAARREFSRTAVAP